VIEADGGQERRCKRRCLGAAQGGGARPRRRRPDRISLWPRRI